MYELLLNENTRYVTINQIKNFLAEYKDQQYGNTNITLNQLTAFVADHLAVPDEIDKAFVVKFDRSDDHEEQWFHYFVTTRRLLEMSCDAKVIHEDSTMKATIQGYPLLACGTSDEARHFHLFGLMLSTNETSADYEFMFESL